MMPSTSFSLQNLLRGRLAEQILTVLLDLERYLALGPPEQLRTLPDLLVADPGVTWAKLIEVKFGVPSREVRQTNFSPH
jgi:hypothetical protein